MHNPQAEKQSPSLDTNNQSNSLENKDIKILNSCRCRRWVFILLIALILQASVVFLSIQQIKITQSHQADYFQTILNALSSQQLTLKTTFQNSLTTLETKQKELQSEFNTLKQQVEVTLDLEKDQAQPWQLNKARYYIELAAINAHWTNNEDTSIALLQEANKILQKIPTPALDTIKQALINDISSLQSASKSGIADWINTLNEAQATIETLPFKSMETSPGSPKPLSNWHQRLEATFDFLKQVIIIHRHHELTAPLMSPLYQAILRERIIMSLQEAQWALLQNNTKLYQQSLRQVLDGVPQCFDISLTESQDLLKKLSQLQQTPLNAKKPDFTKSLSALSELINEEKEQISNKTLIPSQGKGKAEKNHLREHP